MGMVMSMRGIRPELERWQLDVDGVHSRMYLAPTPRERTVARHLALGPGHDRLGHRRGTGTGCSHNRQMGHRLQRGRSGGPDLRAVRRFPPALEAAQQAALRATVQELPAKFGIGLANWNWKVIYKFVSERFGISLCRSRCLNYLRRLGFVLRRPKVRLVKADEAKREAFVAEYATLSDEARRSGAKIFFADEAHFRADAELRGKWVLRGEPALTDSGSPRRGEKASYYSAVCLETGEVEWMGLEGNSNFGTSAASFKQLRQRHTEPLKVIWDNAPAHRGEAVREYLRTPDSAWGW